MPTADWEHKKNETLIRIRESSDISDHNKELIEDYHRDKTLDGMSEATLDRNLTRLKIMAEHLNVEFDEMDRSDVKDLVAWLMDQDYAEGTVNTYKTVIRSFWRWINPTENGDAPEEVSWIKITGSNGNGKLPKDLLTQSDIKEQVRAAHNPRDKALIMMLYETGARIGEIIDLTVGDIEDREHGKKVVIEGKTGARRLPLVESVPYLNRWLNQHPTGNKENPLWCKIRTQNGHGTKGADELTYNYINKKILKKTMEKAGIDKPANPHHYRHSRASYLANELKEAQLCEWFGWVQGSDVPAKYVHLSGRDIDNAYDQMHGLYEPEEDENSPDVIECWRCEELEDPERRYCGKCGAPLDKEARGDVEVEQEKAEGGVVEVENQTEAKILQSVLSELRENPGEFLAE